jgi:hypothetical protein
VSDESEWGPWIDHDGKGCPVVGMWVQVELLSGEIIGPFVAHSMGDGSSGDAWAHDTLPSMLANWAVIRYRVLKPSALRELIEMVENLPAPQKQPERVDG